MKAVDILYLSLGMMLYPLFACGANAADNKKDIATYFANSLKGEKVEYSISKKVKKNEVNSGAIVYGLVGKAQTTKHLKKNWVLCLLCRHRRQANGTCPKDLSRIP